MNDPDIAAVREWARFNHHQLDEELGSSQPTTAKYNAMCAALARVEARLEAAEKALREIVEHTAENSVMEAVAARAIARAALAPVSPSEPVPQQAEEER